MAEAQAAKSGTPKGGKTSSEKKGKEARSKTAEVNTEASPALPPDYTPRLKALISRRSAQS